VNFLLSTYSVFGEKNVSPESENNFERAAMAGGCPEIGTN
jgi:hypothetical protein